MKHLYKIVIASLCFVNFSCKSQIALKIIADGNSYVEGNGFTPFSVNVGTAFGVAVTNFGVGGQTTTQMLADETSQVLSQYDASKRNYLLVCEIGNDLATYGTVAKAITNITTYCTNARAAGFKVILATLIHRAQNIDADPALGRPYHDSTYFNAMIDSVNVSLKANHSFVDGLAVIDTCAVFQNYGAGYASDRVHPNAVGQPTIGNAFNQQIYFLNARLNGTIRGRKAIRQ